MVMKVKDMLECHKLLAETKPEKDSPDFETWKGLMESSWNLILEQRERESKDGLYKR